MFGGNFKMSLSLVQQEIVDTPGNVIVSASAGTGKTHKNRKRSQRKSFT